MEPLTNKLTLVLFRPILVNYDVSVTPGSTASIDNKLRQRGLELDIGPDLKRTFADHGGWTYVKWIDGDIAGVAIL